MVTEPGYSSKDIHPCQEQWLLLEISADGKPCEYSTSARQLRHQPQDKMKDEAKPEDITQIAALRLATRLTQVNDGLDSPPEPVRKGSDRLALETLFLRQAALARDRADGVDALYWIQASNHLSACYPLSNLANNDTEVLCHMQSRLKAADINCVAVCEHLDNQLSLLQKQYADIKQSTRTLTQGLNRLRVKLWYVSDITSSSVYEYAKNITSALLNMAIPNSLIEDNNRFVSPNGSRRGSSVSSSSIFDQQNTGVTVILKASKEFGGPKKLADEQIESTKKWLQRNSVDNFCKGEERIHRFCMEIKATTYKLVSDSMTESPVLWASDLFVREKQNFEINPTPTPGGYSVTRPPSILSETQRSSMFQMRPSIRSNDGSVRSAVFDTPARKASFHSLGSSRLNRDLLGSELASSFGSRSRTLSSRAASATTAESITSIFSPLPSNSRSATSASLYSRPGSTYNDSGHPRLLLDYAKEKVVFLDKLQQDLICLLLSDLGCPVWSRGSETDAWLDTIRDTAAVDTRLKHRLRTAKLLPRPSQRNAAAHRRQNVSRKRHSMGATHTATHPVSTMSLDTFIQDVLEPLTVSSGLVQFRYEEALADALSKMSQQADPLLKLRAVHDFETLALSDLKARVTSSSSSETRKQQAPTSSEVDHRRASLDSRVGLRQRPARPPATDQLADHSPTESEIIEHLKLLLAVRRPKTLFRDLQYIAAFVAPDTLNKSESGRAFLHLGLAALAYKDEVCRSMVDLAAKAVAQDMIKRHISQAGAEHHHSVARAAEYWIVAAREGNAIAQRELASLYLTHPQLLPIVSLPLSLASETFRPEMMWQKKEETSGNWQALCLALHWMQQAAKNGDPVAQKKLNERNTLVSLR